MNPHASIATEGTYAPVDLFESDLGRIERKVTIASGAGVLAPGSVLGRITTGGKFVLSDATEDDGSQTPRAILAQTVDATSADAEAIVYEAGNFRLAALIFGYQHTAASARDGLRSLGIFYTNPEA
jgi:hypothetical protein